MYKNNIHILKFKLLIFFVLQAATKRKLSFKKNFFNNSLEILDKIETAGTSVSTINNYTNQHVSNSQTKKNKVATLECYFSDQNSDKYSSNQIIKKSNLVENKFNDFSLYNDISPLILSKNSKISSKCEIEVIELD